MVKQVSPGSSINKRADELGPAPSDMQRMGTTLIDYGGGPAPAGAFWLALDDYSTPIYKYAEEHDGQGWVDRQPKAYFFPTAWSLAAGSAGNVAPGTLVPDNLAWVGGTGNDNIMLVERDSTGEMWAFWMVRQMAINCVDIFNYPGPSFQNLGAGILWKNPTHTAAGCSLLTNVYKPVSGDDMFERGNGMKQRELMVTVDEMLEGEIRHAVQLTLTNTWFSEGPANQGKPGIDYFAPARRCEWDRARSIPTREGHVFPTDKSKLTVHGLRIRFLLTPTERNRWLDRNVGRSKTPFREFCRIYLNALCDYGMVTTDTGHWGMLSQFDGVLGPAGPKYNKHFGIDRTKTAGFAKQKAVFSKFMVEFRDRVQVVAPAT